MESKINKPIESTRVVIIGAGSVGATCAYTLMVQEVVSEIVLLDMDRKKSEGEVMDMVHGLPFVKQTKIWAGDYSDCKEADLIIITAGKRQAPGQSRLELVESNKQIIESIIENIEKYTTEAIILMVTNPVDILTYSTQSKTNCVNKRIFGSGTALDSSRFQYLLAKECGVAANDVSAFIIGEHGESSVPVFSHANILGESIINLKERCTEEKMQEIYMHVKNAAGEIIEKKGATFYAIALSVARIVRAVIYDTKAVIPVSVRLENIYGINDVCLSLPAVIGRHGVERIITINLSDREKEKFIHSAQIVEKVLIEARLK